MNLSRQHLHYYPLWRERADAFVSAALPEPGEVEQLWVTRLTDSRYRVCCVPLFLYDIALGDIVEVDQDALAVRVVESSGRYVLRIFFPETGVDGNLLDELETLGCGIERTNGRLVAVDCENETLASRASGILLAAENEGRLQYETGRTA